MKRGVEPIRWQVRSWWQPSGQWTWMAKLLILLGSVAFLTVGCASAEIVEGTAETLYQCQTTLRNTRNDARETLFSYTPEVNRDEFSCTSRTTRCALPECDLTGDGVRTLTDVVEDWRRYILSRVAEYSRDPASRFFGGSWCEVETVCEPFASGTNFPACPAPLAPVDVGSICTTEVPTRPEDPDIEVRVDMRPRLDVDFPDTEVGETSAPITIEVHNVGGSALLITNPVDFDRRLPSDGDDDFPFSSDCSPTLEEERLGGHPVEPGGHCTINVQFHPMGRRGGSEAVLTILSNDPNEGMVRLRLRGNAFADVAITSGPDPFCFDSGPASVDACTEETLWLVNDGERCATVSSIGIVGAPNFQIVSAPPTPFEFCPGEPGPRFVGVRFCLTDLTNWYQDGQLVLNFGGSRTAHTIPLWNPLRSCGTAIPPPEPPEIDVTTPPPTPLTVEFPDTPVGMSVRREVMIMNVGRGPLLLDVDFSAGTPGDFIHSSDCPSPILAAGAAPCRSTIEFRPMTPERHSGMITIRSNDTDENPLTIQVTGNALGERDIEVAPLSLDFADTPIGMSADMTVTIRNAGGMPLMLNAMPLSGADSGDFMVPAAMNGCAPPRTLGSSATDNTCRFVVQFRPTGPYRTARPDRRTAGITVGSDDPDEGMVSVSLAGNAVGGRIAVSPDPVCFPAPSFLAPCAPQTVTIRNDGPGELRIRSMTIVQPSTNFEFVGAALRDVTLPPSGARSIQLCFRRRTTNTGNAELVIDSDDREARVTLVNPFNVSDRRGCPR